MKCEKPQYTEEMRAKLNKMYKLLRERFYSKEELSEFKRFCNGYYDGIGCKDCEYFIDARGYEYDESDCACDGLKPLTRPPQSYMYVEELDND